MFSRLVLSPIVFFAFLWVAAAWGEGDTPGRKIAFVIGVQKYNHSSLADLQFAERDATELADRLKKAGFEVVLLTTGSAEKPTYENITSRVKKQLGQVTKHDMLVVAMSGHGLQFDDSDENFFCPLDANPATRERLFSLKNLVADMDASGAGTKLLLVDACRDEPKLPRNSKGASGDSIDSLPRGVAALFSCAASEIAWESDKAGGGHGIFFHTVIEGLDGEAANGMGEVTWDRLVAHVKENVPVRVREWVGERVRQRPHQVASLEDNPVLVRVARTITKPEESMRRPTSETSSNAKSITSKTTGAKLLLIPAGEFLMGSNEAEAEAAYQELKSTSTGEVKREWFTAETPAHRVKITKPFYLGEAEVTRGAFSQFVEATGYKTEAEKIGNGGWGLEKSTDGLVTFKQSPKFNWRDYGVAQDETHPVVNVSWNDAVAFTEWLSKVDGRAYRLPTESEWEYACRAGTSSRYSFGEDAEELYLYANVADASYRRERSQMSVGKPISTDDGSSFLIAIKTYRPNPFGLFDMHGSVTEWCSDLYGDYPTGTLTDPKGPMDGSLRVLRGGAWSVSPVVARSSHRYGFLPAVRGSSLGFRLASSSVE